MLGLGFNRGGMTWHDGYLTGKVLTSAEIKIINFHSERVWEFQNVSQPETSQEEASPECRTESGPGRESSQMLGMGNFPDIFWKNLVPGKWHSGMQTSKKIFKKSISLHPNADQNIQQIETIIQQIVERVN